MIRPGSYQYNDAVASSSNQQLLLNIVRMRYDEPPSFLQVTSVTTGYEFKGDINANANIGKIGGLGNTLASGTGASYLEKPTISYQPLTGQEFSRQLLSPISAESLILMARSGWSMKSVVLALVDEINGLPNPKIVNADEAESHPFVRVATLLDELQSSGVLRLQVASQGKGDSKLIISGTPAGKRRAQVEEVSKLLKLPNNKEFAIKRIRKNNNEISIVGRSLLDALRFLSYGIDTPDRPALHPAKDVFTVQSSTIYPRKAFVRIAHDGRYYYIPNDDYQSKRVFAMVSQLFSLQAASDKGLSPLLTISQ